MTVKELLIAARSIIDTPEKWTKGAVSRDRSGSSLFRVEGGVKWCMLGAVELAIKPTNTREIFIFEDAVSQLNKVLGSDSVSEFNDRDTTTHEDVLRVFDKAIEEVS
jgi:hypothetical protein